MKKVLAVILAVTLLATTGGVVMAANYQETGNGSLSGPHYNLNIISSNGNKNSEMTGTQGHTIFVKDKGRTKIMLYNSDAGAPCSNDFEVLDRNGLDGTAKFCLPEPEVTQGDCPLGESEVSYTVFARALGTPGGRSFTTTCATDPDDDLVYCSSITMKLERSTGKSSFQDVSKYLLFVYLDGTRYPLFDSRLEDYFWRYDNDGLKLAQLRFYETPTCVPDEVASMSITAPDCFALDSIVGVTITGATGADFTGIGENDIFIVDADGKKDNKISIDNVLGSGTSLTFDMDIDSGGVAEEKTIYVTDATGETMSTTFTVLAAGGCSI